MKKHYKILLLFFLIEVFILSIMKDYSIKVQSWIGNALATFLLLLPIQILFFLLSKDEIFSEKKRMLFKILFWFINICYVLGGIAALF